ncbi:polysaccharide biosynthesis protein [Facklamia hominis]|uniref:polysaccharide biosynthesis protein n=1 Tax=Facklamia hominis TaxID=178214 RepID=UPI0038FD17F7
MKEFLHRIKLTRRRKQAIIILSDLACILLSAMLAAWMVAYYVQTNFFAYGFIALAYFLAYAALSFYHHNFSGIVRFFNIRDARSLILTNLVASGVSFILGNLVLRAVSNRYIFLLTVFAVGLMILCRILWKTYIDWKNLVNAGRQEDAPRLLLVGAGEGANIFIENFAKHPDRFSIIGLVDDDPNKQSTYLRGVPVLGVIDDLPKIIPNRRIETITITAPSLSSDKVEQVLKYGNEYGASVNQMPEAERVLSGEYKMQMKEIDIADLLGRKEIRLDDQPVIDAIGGKVIMVTGGGGSIGSEICRQVLKFGPSKLYFVGHGENSIYQLDQELSQMNLSHIQTIPVIADIQDKDHMVEIMNLYQPDIVYHAAAHKHVPMMEYNPTEAVRNNVYGTYNVAYAASKAGVERFVMISTDKANNPPNIMGATKRIAEMIVTGMDKESKTTFSAVRFGNVLGSRGSVIPLFKKQIAAGGPITVTHPEMRRYFMTIPEASRLVIQASALAEGGELFILNMGKEVYIKDLARKMIALSGYREEEIPIVYTGIRPGEKLYETLIMEDEVTDKKIDENIFVGKVKNKSLEEIKTFVEGLDLSGKDNRLTDKVTEFVHRDAKDSADN